MCTRFSGCLISVFFATIRADYFMKLTNTKISSHVKDKKDTKYNLIYVSYNITSLGLNNVCF